MLQVGGGEGSQTHLGGALGVLDVPADEAGLLGLVAFGHDVET